MHEVVRSPLRLRSLAAARLTNYRLPLNGRSRTTRSAKALISTHEWSAVDLRSEKE